jgi:hypothetical protein
MTESEWLTCTDPVPMFDFIQDRASARKLRMFGMAHLISALSRS